MLRERCRDRPLYVAGTGSGKTTVASEIIRRHTERGGRSLFLVHRKELVDQAVNRLADHSITAGRIRAGDATALHLPVQVASILTLARRKHWPASLVIVDEAQHAPSQSFRNVLDRYPDAIICGLTATPCRLDGKGLGDYFGCIVEPITTAELVAAGYLVAPKVFAPPVDLSGIKKSMGDYSLPELVDRVSPLVGSITATWLERARGMRTICFACTIEHSRKIVEAFQAAGVNAAHVDGTTAEAEREDALTKLRAGDIDIISNVALFGEGVDMPELQCVILARPTKSLALFRQAVGRVLRPPGPVIVLDHAGNHHEHGLVTDPVIWSLTGAVRKPQAASVRTCRVCFALYDPALPACPDCGTVALPEPRATKPGVENEGELVEFKTRESKADYYRAVVIDASRSRYAIGWARMRYKAKFGTFPRFPEIEEEEYECPDHAPVLAVYGPKRVLRCGKCCRSEAEAWR